MTSMILKTTLAAVVAVAAAQPVASQSAAKLRDTFSGQWYIFDEAFGRGGMPCKINLEREKVPVADTVNKDPRFQASTQNCSGPLEGELTWRVEDGKIILASKDGGPVAAVGGNPRRLSGDYVAPPNTVVLERETGSGAKSQLSSAIKKHGCYYLGYTANCADESATQRPDLEDGTASVNVVVSLNVRNQPRRSAPVIGTVPSGSDVTVNACLTTSDGIWCRARFGESVGWMAKSALRQGEWPVITYVNAAMGGGA